jgi:hypothetical protein
MTRSEFLRLFAGVGALTLVACKKSDDDTPVDAPSGGDARPSDGSVDSGSGIDGPPSACPMTRSAISGNHGHSLAVSAADVTAGVEKSYNIMGSSGHPHTVLVTAAMFSDLQDAKPVTVDSSEDAEHAHTVTITCV